ncbi:PHP domain-containing protein [Aquibacillus albus]|uniref:Metal-dependent phosphoesterase TrpH n=1 Tax=Aquibacillus albus TaxID=1168171 RepID=A0ABS2N5A6_9BACI|nr:PHP domain-containing protein [Aquibacillus albus]MBM7573312.1 putative metal-dependent phosphoesterase TrpH [Aquibacillus albus]
MKIDLHCHTKISDNSFSTEEVILQAKQQGVTHLAITDHDTTIGLQLAIEIGKEQGVEIIPGIEISAYDFKRNRRAHILGLYVTPGHDAIYQLCQPLIEKRHQASYEMVRKLIEAGYSISWEEVSLHCEGGTGVYKQHIMHALLEKGYTNEIFGALYKKLFSRGGPGHEPGIAYVPITYIDVFDAIRVIKAAGGIPVLAHPGQFDNFSAVSELVEAGLKGIEINHPLHNHENRVRALEIANEYQLIKTGGSDFHGLYSDTQSTLGSETTEEDWFMKIKEKIDQG